MPDYLGSRRPFCNWLMSMPVATRAGISRHQQIEQRPVFVWQQSNVLPDKASRSGNRECSVARSSEGKDWSQANEFSDMRKATDGPSRCRKSFRRGARKAVAPQLNAAMRPCRRQGRRANDLEPFALDPSSPCRPYASAPG